MFTSVLFMFLIEDVMHYLIGTCSLTISDAATTLTVLVNNTNPQNCCTFTNLCLDMKLLKF